MWTTKITTIDKHKAVFDCTVQFFKNEVFYDEFTFKNVSEPDSIKRLIREQLNQYKKIDGLALKAGDIDAKEDVVVDTPIDKTEAELTELDFIDRLDKLKKMKVAVDLGFDLSTNYATLLGKLKTDYKARYLKHF